MHTDVKHTKLNGIKERICLYQFYQKVLCLLQEIKARCRYKRHTFFGFSNGVITFFSRQKEVRLRHKKSVESSCCLFHELRLFQLPIKVEQTTSEPTPI